MQAITVIDLVYRFSIIIQYSINVFSNIIQYSINVFSNTI